MCYRTLFFLTGAVALTLSVRPGFASPMLRDGDRMVFLGDSITEQRIHTRYVMNYFALRCPGARISFRNAGWSGDTARGALARLQRDVLSLKPTLVSICFGMNDGGVAAFSQPTYDRYMDAMTGLVSQLKAAGVKVVLLTPGCVDPDQKPSLAVYNDTLGRFAQGVELLAKRENLPAFNMHKLMLDVQTRAKADDPKFTMIPDGVHPSAPGQALMAYGLLKALGCDELPSGLEIDAAAGRAIPDRCAVVDLKIGPDSISFSRTDRALPTWFDPEAEAVFRYCPALAALNLYPLKVTGLKPGNWKLMVQGVEVGTFSSVQLSGGVNLAPMPGPWRALGEAVNALSAEQERLYHFRWKELLVSPPSQAQPEFDALLAKLDKLVAEKEAERIRKAAGQRWEWSLTLLR